MFCRFQHPAIPVVLFLAVVGVGLSACALQQAPTQSEIADEALPSSTEIPPEWAADAADSGKVDDGWIAAFGDEQLEALVAEMLQNNLNLRLAATQVERASAISRLAAASLSPMVGVGGDYGSRSVSRKFAGYDPLSGDIQSATAFVSWEADVWGKLRARARAGEESLAATEADFEFARQSMAAITARAWFLAIETRLQLELAEEAVEIFTKILELVEAKHEVGQLPLQNVYLTGADLASAQEAVRLVRSAHEQILRALEVLLGRYPSAELETADALVAVPPPIPAGVPADIVARRVDLIAAERRVAAAFFASEEARLARLPSFSITGVAGTTALTNEMAQLSAGLFAPIFAGGALEAQVEIANTNQQAAIAAYGLTLLIAYSEVENALNNERLFTERQQFLEKAVADNSAAMKLTMKQFDVGRVDMLSVLQIQARVLAARSALIGIQNQRLVQRINLHLALGGSFENTNESEGVGQ
jgi:NodT family efflux transporter outer membrane factor (OMF) lipoprotein